MNHELAKTLTTALVQFIDREQPKDEMSVSSFEAEELERCFIEEKFHLVKDWYASRMKPKLTEFEQFMDGVVDDTIRETYSEDGFRDICKDALNLAKKELFKQGEGTYYYRPKNDELTYIDSMPMRMPYAVPEMHTLRPLCYEPGGTCTNPQMDCINCPRKTTGGIFTSPNTATSPNTVSCGTATQDGKTSVTDGKPHNPSFTD